jgi:hypothetical protein
MSSVRMNGIGSRVRKLKASRVSAKGLIFHVFSLVGDGMSFTLYDFPESRD